ncbi:uncharacterized protein [Macrobrachium rosenbergii]|uniref:uncharacterized protein n=1 Tax=Macrobrachium rosenbergii TaxID=79674 RepID=UPI0034D64511
MSLSTAVSEAKSLITEDHVKKALKADKGIQAFLKSWKVVDFTKRGDNYACEVTSVEVKYSMNNKEDSEVTYVVKLNPHRNFGEFQEAEPFLFEKEGKFYEELVPVLNEALMSAGQKPLRFAKCFLVSLEEGKEQLYFEDLRARGFKMFDRRKGMDKNHIALVLSELARLHGASYLLTNKVLEGESAGARYEFLSKDLLDFTPNTKELFVSWMERCVDTGIMMLDIIGGYETASAWLKSFRSVENVLSTGIQFVSWMERCVDTGIMMLDIIGGYETASAWLKSFRSEVENVLSTGIRSTRFSSICHGDCWNNNVLFRYNAEGRPVEVMLLDLQMCREASAASDLNYLLFTSVNGDVRKPNLRHFMSLYHSTYKEVLEGGDMPMHFTIEELMEEFRDKNKFGLVFALVIIPLMLTEPEEVPDMSNTDFETLMNGFRDISLEKLKTNPLCKPRFLSIFDEFMETGLIS